jgi:hypothetical protein
MKIKVVFKEKFGELGTKEYTYATDIEDIAVNDEVVVRTRYGLALAIVKEVYIQDDIWEEEELQKVVLVAESAADKKAREEAIAAKTKIMEKLIENARKNKLLSELRLVVNAEDFEKYVADMTLTELEELYFELM